MEQTLIIAGGIYHILLIVFHLMFWRLFDWPGSLRPLDTTNRSTMQVLNITLTLIFVIFAYISIAHTEELLTTSLGYSLIVLISMLWLARTILQVVYYGLQHRASRVLTLCFITGACLYGIPAIVLA